jgi:hypothetical protein
MTKRIASQHLHPPVLYACSFEKPGYFLAFSGTIFGQIAAAATTVRAASFGTFLRLYKGSTGATDGAQFSSWFQHVAFHTVARHS